MHATELIMVLSVAFAFPCTYIRYRDYRVDGLQVQG